MKRGCSLIVIAVVILILIPLILIPAVLAPGGGSGDAATPYCGVGEAANVPEGETVAGYSGPELSHAAAIIQVGKRLNVSERGIMIALMTAIQESDLGRDEKTRKPNSDHDAGIFQQRILPGWYGTLEEVNDPVRSAELFFQGKTVEETVAGGAGPKGYHIPGLLDIPGWETMVSTLAANEVQGSTFPHHYAKHQGVAMKLIEELRDTTPNLQNGDVGCDSVTAGAPAPAGVTPTQAELAMPSAALGCPEGSTDLGVQKAAVEGKKIDIRICSIANTICTGTDCAKGSLGGLARGEVIVNARVAPLFMDWLKDVRAQGYNPTFISSFRSWRTQANIWRGGANTNAARPGWSNHQSGMAVDVAGLPGTYNRNNCTGHKPDGSCMGSGKLWQALYTTGVKYGALPHNGEFWHFEWVISNRSKRHIPWLK
ncbi:D-alanyl-D-alanine carboxypeptidase family protein [Dermabacteraceae bacterium TAE3-ERU27]|nr:D-alanyl-D-alanine carboxypeptidase family protein [Dermabacteraceae bacterium TAE3-ERU27]